MEWAASNLTVSMAPLPGSMGSVGLGVCEAGAPGRSELGLLCRGKVVGRGSLQGAWEPYHERSPGTQSGCPHPDPAKPHSPCSWRPPVTYVHLEESSTPPPRCCISTHPPGWGPSPPNLSSPVPLFEWWRAYHPPSQARDRATPCFYVLPPSPGIQVLTVRTPSLSLTAPGSPSPTPTAKSPCPVPPQLHSLAMAGQHPSGRPLRGGGRNCNPPLLEESHPQAAAPLLRASVTLR